MASRATGAAARSVRGLTADHRPLSSASQRAVSLRPPAATVAEGIPVANSGPMRRSVFGGVATPQEAVEATSEVSDLSIGYSPSSLQSSPALAAFRFVRENPPVQRAIESAVQDPNVWNAVMHNPQVNDLISSGIAYGRSSTPGLLERGPVADGGGSLFATIIRNALFHLMIRFAHFFANLFRGEIYFEFSGASFLVAGQISLPHLVTGVVVIVILVIVLKRAAAAAY